MFETDSWCAQNQPSVSTITPGVISADICTYWNDVYRSVDFTPPVINAPSACTDETPTFMYEIDATTVIEPDFLKISLDSAQNKIYVIARSGLTLAK